MPVHVRLTNSKEDVFHAVEGCSHCYYPDKPFIRMDSAGGSWCANCQASAGYGERIPTTLWLPDVEVRDDGTLVVTKPHNNNVIGYYRSSEWKTWRVV